MNAEVWNQVTAVVVTFNSAAILEPCLRAAAGARKVIVVDNASTDDSVAVAQRVVPAVDIVRNPLNMGYGTANNIGFARAETPFVLLLNPDAEVQPGCVEALVAAADANPDAAVIVPVLRSAEGRREFYTRAFREFQFYPCDDLPEGPFCTGFVAGTVMLWRLDIWKEIGGFDEAFFMYGEDHDLTLRVEAKGRAMIVEPAAEAVHLSGKSSRRTLRMVLRRDWFIMWSSLRVEAKWSDAAQARQRAWKSVGLYGAKTLLYILLLRFRRALGNLVKAHAAAAWLRGAPSWPGRPATGPRA